MYLDLHSLGLYTGDPNTSEPGADPVEAAARPVVVPATVRVTPSSMVKLPASGRILLRCGFIRGELHFCH